MFDKQQGIPNYQQQALYYQQQQYLKQQQTQTPPLLTSPSPNLQQQQQQQLPQQQQLLSDDFNRKMYGLGKIESYLKERDTEQAIFTLGLDLTNLGLNLNDTQDLHTNFCSPFSDQPTRKVHSQSYQIPPYYLKQTVLKNEHFKKFSEETLFYIFYNVIEEKYQLNAVEELQQLQFIYYLLRYQRGWKFNKKLETWCSKIEESGDKKKHKCKYFSVKKWVVQEITDIEVDIDHDFLTINQFRESINIEIKK